VIPYYEQKSGDDSCVYYLVFNGRMESKISEANSHIIILVCERFTLMAISYKQLGLLKRLISK
jgi:hypothetical protein